MNIDVAMKMLQPVDPGYGVRQSATAAYKVRKKHVTVLCYGKTSYFLITL